MLAVTPYISRIMRGSMVEVLESEYVTMARLKGLPERTVIWRHAVPNAIVPAIQVAALQLAWMAGGVVIVEFVFQYPGIGAALVDSVANRDMPVVQTVTMLAAGIYVGLNLLADLATDPRHPAAEDGGPMTTHGTVDTAVELGLEGAIEGPVPPPEHLRGHQWLWILRRAAALTRTRVGLGLVGLVVAVAVFGPLFAPHSPTEFVAVPNSAPSSAAMFGADALGRDVLSRFLHGGLTVLWMSLAATAMGIGVGTVVGLVAAYARNWLDDLLMRGQRRDAVLPADHLRAARRRRPSARSCG